ncbi:DUF4267 domain-containing protein [Glycomyces niveus]|uniref:DUF4267 domain-containing protein n=1 Tax=Glycomyces niveus TaxID=2820287 RepID=A0ABS3U7H0_9ACTN|nr:DUF4267 domain-containing protein [Glycomyces sp. NEAU-S30]MBO3734727.1 DUF4267 domain-containing protein [Glycomyces sp. NEAU-S30]
MLAIVAYSLASLIGLAVVAMGATGMLKPQFYAGFGIPGTPADDPVLNSWLTVKGGRDFGSGAMLLVAIALGTSSVAGGVMLAAAVMPVFDGLIVVRAKGPRSASYGVHFSTAAVMVVVAALLFLV